MKEVKFKAGDRVFSIQGGVGTVNEAPKFYEDFVHVEFPGPKYYEYLLDGRQSGRDTHRSLYTLDEARAMGFQVPDEQVTFKAYVDAAARLVGITGETLIYPGLEGKCVKVTIKEVTE